MWCFDPMVSPYGALRSHLLDTPHSVRLLWTSDQPEADKTQYSLETNNPTPRDSKPQPQLPSGRRPTPYTAQPKGSAEQ